MRIIIGNRGSGKTTELVKYACENKIPILVYDWHAKEYVNYVAREMGNTVSVMSIGEFKSIPLSKRPSKVAIDEISLFMKSVLGTDVDCISVDCSEQTSVIFLRESKVVTASQQELPRKESKITAFFLYPDNGYDSDIEKAKKYLKFGQSYKVLDADVGQSNTKVVLEVDGQKVSFNSVHFKFFRDENEVDITRMPEFNPYIKRKNGESK